MTVDQDPYSRLDYRRMVAWPKRREREWPLLARVLAAAPSKRVLDLGCGTGEHARLLAENGYEVLGVDRSAAMIARARDAGEPPGVRFVEADLSELGDSVDGKFGAALCLGNTLPHLRTPGELAGLTTGLAARLASGAPLLVQLLNYQRIVERGERHLPLNFRPSPEGEQGEIVFLRLMTPRPDGTVLFTPTTLRYRPDSETPVELVDASRVLLRGWRLGELEEALTRVGFEELEAWSGFDADPFEPSVSRDLLLRAVRC